MPQRRDIATFSAELHEDEFKAFAESYAYTNRMLIASLQVMGGEVELPADWWERSAGKVAFADWIDDGRQRVYVVDRIGEIAEREQQAMTEARKRNGWGRNWPCLCGSGKKFKRCCGR